MFRGEGREELRRTAEQRRNEGKEGRLPAREIREDGERGEGRGERGEGKKSCAPLTLCSPGEGAAGAIERDLDER
jgi:hypothetical protein